MLLRVVIFFFIISGVFVNSTQAWFDETHLAVAKVAGYQKWFKSTGADVARIKLGDKEGHNHYVNNARGTVVTPEMVLAQVEKYNQIDRSGHLYGAIIASVRDYIEVKKKGRYSEYHLAYAAHYIGDLSMPLHHTLYEDFNRRYHSKIDGIDTPTPSAAQKNGPKCRIMGGKEDHAFSLDLCTAQTSNWPRNCSTESAWPMRGKIFSSVYF